MRAAIVYSLFASCKAHDVEIMAWLEDTLRRLPMEKDIKMLLPENWQPDVTRGSSEAYHRNR